MAECPVRGFQVPTRGAMLAVYEAHPPEHVRVRGTAFFVPGVVAAKEDFNELTPALTGAGYRICTYDHRGMGGSSSLPRVEDHSMRAFVDDLRTIIWAMADGPGPVHLVGHGLGGLVARAATISAPGEVRSLTLLESGPSAETFRFVDMLRLAGRTEADREDADRGRADRSEPGAIAERWLGIARQLTERGVMPAFIDRVEQWVFAATPETRIGLGRAYLNEPDRTDELAATGVPVLGIHAEDDWAWPTALQADMVERVGGSSLPMRRTGPPPYGFDPSRVAAALIDLWTSADDREPVSDLSGFPAQRTGGSPRVAELRMSHPCRPAQGPVASLRSR